MRRRDPNNRLTKLTLLITSTLTVMAGATIAPALPAIQEHFAGIANAGFWVRLVLTLPALFIAGMAPVAGYLVDRIGRKKVLVASTLLYGFSGVAGYLAPTLGPLLISRATLGLSVGGLMTSVTTLIADYYAGKARSRFLGFQAGFIGLGGTAFLAVGGALAEIDWRTPFLIYLSAFAILVLILTALYEPSPAEQCVEKPNPVFDPGECVAEAMRTGEGGLSEAASAAPLPTRLISFVYLTTLVVQVIWYLIPVQLPFYLRDLIGATASQSGLAISVITFFFALAALQFGRIASRLNPLEVITLAFALLGAGYLLISLAAGWALILIGLVIGGIGLGMMMPNLNVWLANESPPASRGRVLGGLTTALFLGQFLSPIVSQPVNAAVGLGGMYLSAGALLWVMVPLSLATRKGFRYLTA